MAWESEEVGVGEFTENKQAEFRALLGMIMNIVAGKARRGEIPHVFYYFDLYAGTGWAKGAPGSVIIAIEEAERAGLLLRAWLFEEDRETAELLRANLHGRPGDMHVIEGDNQITVPQIIGQFADLKGWRYGVVYSDGNAPARQPVEIIRSLTALPCFQRLDVVAYIGATRIKWWARIDAKVPRLEDQLRAVGKRFTIIRRPKGAEQWTFAVLTNWPEFPQFKKQGYHSIQSREGQETLERLNWTKDELQDKAQPRLEFDAAGEVAAPYFQLPGISSPPAFSGDPRPGDEEGRRRV